MCSQHVSQDLVKCFGLLGAEETNNVIGLFLHFNPILLNPLINWIFLLRQTEFYKGHRNSSMKKSRSVEKF
jgi:hypothetical protein